MIASEAEPAKNSLTTGTLTASDIQNREQYAASQTSLGVGVGDIGADRQGKTSPTGATALGKIGEASASVPIALSASGSEAGTTTSAIAPGTITITSGDAASQNLATSISRDTANANAGALTQAFTEARRAEIADGFKAAQILSSETNAFLARQAAKADQWTRDNPNADPKTNPFATWGAGGTGRLILTALNGAAGSNVTGSLGSLVQGAAVNVLQGLATGEVKGIADRLGSEEARTALQAVVGCAGSAAGGTGDCASAAMGAAASVVLNNLLRTGETTATGPDGKPLSQTEQQARSNLVATIVAAVAQGAGLDTAAATTAAQIESSNNANVYHNGLLLIATSDKGGISWQEFKARYPKQWAIALRDFGGDEAALVAYVTRTNGQSPEAASKAFIAQQIGIASGGSWTLAQQLSDQLANGTLTKEQLVEMATAVQSQPPAPVALGDRVAQAGARREELSAAIAGARGEAVNDATIGKAVQATQARRLAEANPQEAAKAASALTTLRTLGYSDGQIAAMAAAPGANTAAAYTTELNAIRTLSARLPGGADKAAQVGLIIGVTAASLYAATHPLDPAKMTAPAPDATGPQTESLPVATPKPAVEVLPPAKNQTPVLSTPVPKPVGVTPPPFVTPMPVPQPQLPGLTPAPVDKGSVLANTAQRTEIVSQVPKQNSVTSPNSAMRAAANNSGTYVDPLTGVHVTVDSSLAADHIVPQKWIRPQPGFSDLSPADQSAILNDPLNTQGLPQSLNASNPS